MSTESLSIQVDKHITLKELDFDDALSIFNTIDNEREYLGEWLPFVEKTKDIEFTLGFVDSYVNSDKKDLTFAIYVDNIFVGLLGLKDTDLINHKTEIGYWLSFQFQHKGIMNKSCSKLIDYAFNILAINRIQLKAGVENGPSRAIAEGLCFKFEGIEREGELHSRGYIDLAVYGMLKSEFKEIK